MKEIIAFPQLVELVAAKASTTSRMSELFVQELFATVAQALSDGQSVKIKGIGTFKVKKDNSGKDVEFVPDKALSQAVNAPFEQFKPVELCDEVTYEQLAEIDASMEPAPQAESAPQQVEPTVIEPIDEDVTDNDNVQEETEKETQEKEPANKEEQPLPRDSAPVEPEPVEPVKSSSKIKWISIAAAIAAIALIAGIVIHNNGKDNNEIVANKNHSIASPKPEPVVTDTLRPDYRLFDMAQRHYGDQAFWVYIALENHKQFPNYRKIPKGSALVIPPAAKYGINSDSKQSLRNAATQAYKLSKLRKELEKEQGENTDKNKDKNLDKSVEPAKDKKKDKNDDERTIKEEKKDKKNKKEDKSDDKAPIDESSPQKSTKPHKSSYFNYYKHH